MANHDATGDTLQHPLTNRNLPETVLTSNLYPSQTYMFKPYTSHMTAVLYWDPLFTPTSQYLDNRKRQTNSHQENS